MKKALFLILALVLCISLCACGGGSDVPPETTTKPLTAREQLTDFEAKFFKILIDMTKESFYEPSAVRVLEVCDYNENTKYENDTSYYDSMYGPDTIVVRLQGENKAGGTLNHFYLICLKSAENKSEYAQSMISLDIYFGDKEGRMRYKATEGEYVELSDYYSPKKDASDLISVARINKALKEYWEEMGF